MHDLDATLVEINPLAVTPEGIMALDAKMVLDDQARFRHPDLFDRLAAEQPAPDTAGISRSEALAAQRGLNYVPLDGCLGMIADGAGTGMLTMDLICDAGGRPANFCEMGGKSDARIMTEALEVIAADSRVNAILVSLIGGLTRMDEMARGIVDFLKADNGSVPLVVRMCGTRAEVGIPLLREAGIDVYEDLAAAVRAAVDCVQEQ